MPVSVATLAFTVTVMQFLRTSAFQLGIRRSAVAAVTLVSSTTNPFTGPHSSTGVYGSLFNDPQFANYVANISLPSFQAQEFLRSYIATILASPIKPNSLATAVLSGKLSFSHTYFASITSGRCDKVVFLKQHGVSAGFFNAASISMGTLAVVFFVAFVFSLLLVFIN